MARWRKTAPAVVCGGEAAHARDEQPPTFVTPGSSDMGHDPADESDSRAAASEDHVMREAGEHAEEVDPDDTPPEEEKEEEGEAGALHAGRSQPAKTVAAEGAATAAAAGLGLTKAASTELAVAGLNVMAAAIAAGPHAAAAPIHATGAKAAARAVAGAAEAAAAANVAVGAATAEIQALHEPGSTSAPCQEGPNANGRNANHHKRARDRGKPLTPPPLTHPQAPSLPHTPSCLRLCPTKPWPPRLASSHATTTAPPAPAP